MLKKLPLVLVALALMAGCGKAVVATYTAPGETGTETLTLYGDSSFTLGPFPTTDGSRPISLRGTYTARGNDFTFTINDVGALPMPHVNKGLEGGTLSADGKSLTWNGTIFTKAS